MAGNPKKRNPTNAEIMLALRALEKKVDPLVLEVANLQQWKRDQEIAKAAVAEYVKDNGPHKQDSPSSQPGEQWLNRELVKTLGIALAVILALVELIFQLRGIAIK